MKTQRCSGVHNVRFWNCIVWMMQNAWKFMHFFLELYRASSFPSPTSFSQSDLSSSRLSVFVISFSICIDFWILSTGETNCNSKRKTWNHFQFINFIIMKNTTSYKTHVAMMIKRKQLNANNNDNDNNNSSYFSSKKDIYIKMNKVWWMKRW